MSPAKRERLFLICVVAAFVAVAASMLLSSVVTLRHLYYGGPQVKTTSNARNAEKLPDLEIAVANAEPGKSNVTILVSRVNGGRDALIERIKRLCREMPNLAQRIVLIYQDRLPKNIKSREGLIAAYYPETGKLYFMRRNGQPDAAVQLGNSWCE